MRMKRQKRRKGKESKREERGEESEMGADGEERKKGDSLRGRVCERIRGEGRREIRGGHQF